MSIIDIALALFIATPALMVIGIFIVLIIETIKGE